MKEYTIEQVAKLLSNKTHSVYCNVNEFELLRKVLKLAFPEDDETNSYPLEFNDYHGYDKHNNYCWANTGAYLEELEIINLSDIFNIDLPLEIETVTISNEDYDRFLMLEKKAKKSDQKFLDKCAIACINAFISSESQMNKFKGEFIQVDKDVSYTCYRLAKAMLKRRNKIKNK